MDVLNFATKGLLSVNSENSVGFIPPASPWLVDTVNGIDFYKLGFGLTPTIYYDPTATNSSNRGTYKNPYTTIDQINARCQGNMTGQVLGIKRGTISRGALNLLVYGSSENPFCIVPYGDAAALPVISGGIVRTGWTTYSGDSRIWQLTGINQVVDIFENTGTNSVPIYNRLWAVTGATLSAKITAIQSYISSPIANTPGVFSYDGTTLYMYLNDNTNPNLGMVETNDINPISIAYSDVSGTGHIYNVGISGILGRSTILNIQAQNINIGTYAPDDIKIIGCQAAHSGVQLASNLAHDGFLMYGISDTLRLTNGYVCGNYGFDLLNNNIEISATTNAVIEHNIGYNTGGNSIVECWSLNTGTLIQYNKGYSDILTPNRVDHSQHQSGVWLTSLSTLTDNVTRDDTKNGNRVVRFNYIQDFQQKGVDQDGGKNDSIYNNTFVDQNLSNSQVPLNFASTSSTSTGHSAYNNLCISNTQNYYRGCRVDGTVKPTLDYNHYFNLHTSAFSAGGWYYNGTQQGSIDGWRTLIGGETHSRTTLYYDEVTASSIAFNSASSTIGTNTDYSLESSSISRSTGQSLASTGSTMDIDGVALTNSSSPNIGCKQS